jgi:hypothetical protein
LTEIENKERDRNIVVGLLKINGTRGSEEQLQEKWIDWYSMQFSRETWFGVRVLDAANGARGGEVQHFDLPVRGGAEDQRWKRTDSTKTENQAKKCEESGKKDR